MTAEIAIINRQGIALAADSAVTIGRNRVWKTANKLFSLGPINDIAIMIYNTGEFVSIPWETIIKNFRTIVGKKKFSTVKECEIEFFDYLNSPNFSDIRTSALSIVEVIIDIVDDIKEGRNFKRRSELETYLDKILPELKDSLDKEAESLVDVISYDQFIKLYKDDVKVICKDIFKFSLKKTYIDQISVLVHKIISSKQESSYMSGVVFAGFGTKQLLPYISEYVVDGRFQFKPAKSQPDKYITRFWLSKCHDFSVSSSNAIIMPFAQSDMFYLFMEGLVPTYLHYIETILRTLLTERAKSLIASYVPRPSRIVEENLQVAETEATIEQFEKEFEAFRRKTLVSPVLDVVGALPKEEMAAMAEALVELTALRRKVGSKLETVGGPTDVAIISKGDGLIWAKRKHYFKMDLNADYATRKRLNLGGEGT